MRFAQVTLVLMLIVAGCAAFTDGSGEIDLATVNATPAHRENITVTGGTLPIEPEPVFARVQALVNADVSPPRYIILTSTNSIERPIRFGNEFYNTMEIRAPSPVSSSDPSGFTVPNRIYLAPQNGTPAQIEQTLAHEFVHTIQLQSPTFTSPVRDTTTEARNIRAALAEGGATYVTDQYTRRYLPQLRLESEQVRSWYADASPATKLRLAYYRFGSRYIDQRLSSPTNFSSVYATPPNTTEQLIHGLARNAEPPTALPVVSGNDTGQWARSSEDRLGELSVRVILDTYLSEQQAADAAAGWGNDHLLQYSNQNVSQSGFVWVLRWDNTWNATQFETAFEQYLDSRATLTNDIWMDETVALRIERVDERTLAVFVGPRSFVTNATANGDDGEICIRVRALAITEGQSVSVRDGRSTPRQPPIPRTSDRMRTVHRFLYQFLSDDGGLNAPLHRFSLCPTCFSSRSE